MHQDATMLRASSDRIPHPKPCGNKDRPRDGSPVTFLWQASPGSRPIPALPRCAIRSIYTVTYFDVDPINPVLLWLRKVYLTNHVLNKLNLSFI